MPAGSVLRGDFVFAIMLVERCGRRILLDRVNATKPLFSLIYFGLCMGIYGLLFWMPQLIKTAGTSDPFIIGLITTLPYLSAIVGTVLIGRSSDRTGERRWHLAACALAGMIGYALSATYSSSEVGRNPWTPTG
jgi:MFS family permease